MKLKTPAAVSASSAVLPSAHASGSPFPPVVPTHARATYPSSTTPAAPADPFETFVRKMVARSTLAAPAPEAAPNMVNGTVVAQTSIDGVRYVMVRCEPKPGEALLSLSPRERDIVNLITKGYPNKMIADMLDISAWTVGTHLRRIFAKLGVTSRAAMVARYLHYLGD